MEKSKQQKIATKNFNGKSKEMRSFTNDIY